MFCRLFKEPFYDKSRPNVYRLLFEGIKTSFKPEDKLSDMYLYVWIHEKGFLDGFQAVINDEYLVSYQFPSHPTFGSIGKEPIHRSIRYSKSAQMKSNLSKAIKSIKTEYFCDLVEHVKAIAGGMRPYNAHLTHEEMSLFKKLRRQVKS
ncbi:MAG: hypothetical protein GF398_17530 [Chitinivibrionales bacterium]|nr:hypothetical protein [Chitinivibrionales bacterium]